VLALGRSRRLATAAQLRAVIARDRGCIVPGCTLPPGRCDAHHVIWWRHGGPTDVDNLAMLCARHHTCVHAGHWRIKMIDGLPWVIAPRWVDPTQTPRRNALPDAEHTARALGQRLRPEDAA
jgi:5-methylcytosine-specific restriction protein A